MWVRAAVTSVALLQHLQPTCKIIERLFSKDSQPPFLDTSRPKYVKGT